MDVPYRCYRRPDPATGQLYRPKQTPGKSESSVGSIEHTADIALFFHAEKYRGTDEAIRAAIMSAPSFAAGERVVTQHALSNVQRDRWNTVCDKVLLCAAWIATTQHVGAVPTLSPSRFDGLDVAAAMQTVQQQLKTGMRLRIAGPRMMTSRGAGYALIDWFVNKGPLRSGGRAECEPVVEVISSNEDGGDSIGEEWAMRHYIPVAHFPTDGQTPRNEDMCRQASHLLAFHLGNARATTSAIDTFVRMKKPYWRFTEADVARMKQMPG